MSGFLYYWPGANPPQVAPLVDAGFEHAAVAGLPGAQGEGPDDKQGWLFALSRGPHPNAREPADISYYKDEPTCKPARRQTWMKAAGGKWWVGFFDNDRPRAVDLQRKVTVTGCEIELKDEQQWIIPVVRNFDGKPAVEAVVECDENGALVLDRPAAPYVPLWKLIHKMLRAIRELGHEPVITDEELFELAVAGLALNYRVSKWEVSLLRVLSTENMLRFFYALVDMDELNAEG